MSKKVRKIWGYAGNEKPRLKVEIFVYRGYYAIVGHSRALHTPQILRNGVDLEKVIDDDIFQSESHKFDNADQFKERVDAWIESLKFGHGSLEEYYRLNR